VNSKQIVAAVSVVTLLVILIYPALSTGTVSVVIRSSKIDDAEHVYVTIDNLWAHQAGQANHEGWELISNRSRTVDLVFLANSTSALGKNDLPLGNYDSIRVEVSNVTWAYNSTTTKLELESRELVASVEFTVKAGKESSITLNLTGHQQDMRGTKFFVAQLNATITGNSQF